MHRLIAQRLVFDCQRSSATSKRREHATPISIERERKIYRAPLEAEPSLDSGGDSGARTRSLRLAKPALSQLSYIPGAPFPARSVVGLGGLEPPTSRLSGVRSNQLSYRPTPRSVAEEISSLQRRCPPPQPSRAMGRRRPEPGPGPAEDNLAPERDAFRRLPGPKLQKREEQRTRESRGRPTTWDLPTRPEGLTTWSP